jgi:gliding motility-associated-like protein
MKFKILLLLIFMSSAALAQGEANNWFFGQFGGIKFLEDGSVIPLPGGQMFTSEGCSTISDAEGNLLFYTDGRNVWDRNHVLMPNGNYNAGTGLLGDPSSTQSGIIVPKKDDPNIYYIFTVDEPHQTNAAAFPAQHTGSYIEANGEFFIPEADDGFNNGLNYSIVDLSVTGANGSIGDVTTRNVHLVTYNPDINDEAKYKCSEKITAVRNGDGTGYWVIAHFIDKFYSFAVDAAGVNSTPVITQIAPVVPVSGYRRNSIGCIKASPDGEKLAIAHMQFGTIEGGSTINGAVFLYDLDNTTGILSNAIELDNNISPYGVEFSPQGKKLYTSYATDPSSGQGFINQYDMLSADIQGSEIVVANTLQSSTLQLGPNGKIYRSVIQSQFLDVINSPDEDGFLCDFQEQGQFISGTAVFGLPPFITSFLSANMQVENTCEGEQTTFELNVNSAFDSVLWDFGDGTPTTTVTEPVHTYALPGSYTAVATISRQGETTQISRDIVIATIPVANQAPTLIECDPDNDGIAIFALNNNTAAILGTQSPATYDVKYYATQENADNNTGALNSSSYTNTLNPETIFARIYNSSNSECYATTSFQIRAANTPVIAETSFATCDDNADGSDTNGKATFDLTAIAAAVSTNTTDFTTTFYASQANADNDVDPLPTAFTNTAANEQVIFARIVNNTANTCFTIQPVTLTVNPLPINVANVALVQCDTGTVSDEITQFNLAQADVFFTAGDPTFTVTYFLNPDEATTGVALASPYTNISNPHIITARVLNTVTGCVRLMELRLQVNTDNTIQIELERCDDDGIEDGFAEFDLTDAGLEGTADSVIYYAFLNDALQEQNPISNTYTNIFVNLQRVYARVENNNSCVALQEILLLVRPLPDIVTEANAIVCQNTGAFIEIDAGVPPTATGYAYLWSTGQTTRTITVNQPGVYTVEVTNNNNISACSRVRTVTVAPSNVATIDSVITVDLVDNNTVTVNVSPTNNVNTTYLYSLDAPDGPFQESNYFEFVTGGFHTVYVYDINGCGIVAQEISVLQIPKFFTPNGDGINDTWDIVGMNSEFYKDADIDIFDRYGKLLASVDPRSPGWTGNYNGYALPATDYWYVVTLENGRIVKGHFSMIR